MASRGRREPAVSLGESALYGDKGAGLFMAWEGWLFSLSTGSMVVVLDLVRDTAAAATELVVELLILR